MSNIWLAEMPDCFGYGLMVLDHTEDAARQHLKKAYKAMAKSYQSGRSFGDAMDYFGGSVRLVEPGKVYNDGFRE